MDHHLTVKEDEDWFTLAASGLLSVLVTCIYLLWNFEPHQPLFYAFLTLSISVLLSEFGREFSVRVIGEINTLRLRESASSTTSLICRLGGHLLQLRHEEKLTFAWLANCFFLVTFVLGHIMDDAAVIYAACILLSSSPIFRNFFEGSFLKAKVSQMFRPPENESTELEAFMPNVNEVSRDFSVRMRSNTLDSAVTDRDLDVSVFAEDALHNMEVSQASMIDESQYDPVILEEVLQNSAYPTDDDTSPIPSDVEIIELDELPDDEDFGIPETTQSNQPSGSHYTATGTLSRLWKTRKSS